MNTHSQTILLDAASMQRSIERLTHQILERNRTEGTYCLIGIQRRGVFLAQRIQRLMQEYGHSAPDLGFLDITLYRDDLTSIGPNPLVRNTSITFDITDTVVVLIDDVLFTGRTIRCALDEIMDFGRPRKIQLAVLIDRGHRELPIRADFVGKNIPTHASERVEVKVSEFDTIDQVVLLKPKGHHA